MLHFYGFFSLLFLFCSTTDIQEFYELTLLDDTKTIQQKTVETLQIASKWEQENSLKIHASEVSTHTFITCHSQQFKKRNRIYFEQF